MFTGIVEKLGKLKTCSEKLLEVEADQHFVDSLKKGDSVSVNGICLTLIEAQAHSMCFHIGPETVKKTDISNLKTGSWVNLERALKVGDRISGHFVQGHVDTIAKIESITPCSDGSFLFGFRLSSDTPLFQSLLVEQGSIAIDGVSLTLASVPSAATSDSQFTVMILPYTFKHTRFGNVQQGDTVNVEFDVIAKQAQRQIAGVLEKLCRN